MQEQNRDEVVYLYLDDIIPNRFQPREMFDERALKELAVSIKEHGVIQPIIVRNVKGKYEIIAGERRYKASAMAGLTKIPAIIRNLDDKESSKVALLENLQRRDLNPIEEARTYQKILELDQMTQEELAKTMGKSQSSVANKIRLLGLSDEVQEALLKEQISERHARALLNIPDAKKQKEMLKKIINERMTVRQLEDEIKKVYPREEDKPLNNALSNNTTLPINSTAFVNDSPLMPTADLPEDASSYGQIKIAPPIDEEHRPPRFINYGEIKSNDDDEDDNPVGGVNPGSAPAIPNIQNIKDNAIDINPPKSNQTADLDSLLNIMPSSLQNSNQEEKPRFITPAEEIVKTDGSKGNQEKVEDYFKTPDLIPVDLPTEVHAVKETQTVPLAQMENKFYKNNQNLAFSSNSIESKKTLNNPNVNQQEFNEIRAHNFNTIKSSQLTVQQSIGMIRNLVEELNSSGVKAEMEEMNFSKSYQIIIKLDKISEQ